MIRRTSGGGGSPRYDDYDQPQSSSWDGRERRVAQRQYDDYDYDGDDRRGGHHVDTVVIEHPKSQEPVKPSQSWVQANASLLGICLGMIASGGGFIFDLYDRIRDLEYKAQTVTEKIAENRQIAEEIKGMIKESDKNKKEVEAQINSLEDTIMQMYRKK